MPVSYRTNLTTGIIPYNIKNLTKEFIRSIAFQFCISQFMKAYDYTVGFPIQIYCSPQFNQAYEHDSNGWCYRNQIHLKRKSCGQHLCSFKNSLFIFQKVALRRLCSIITISIRLRSLKILKLCYLHFPLILHKIAN